MASLAQKNKELKKQAGVEALNNYSCEYELQTICELFPALTPETALEGNDVFYTKHLLSKIERANFDEKYHELLSKRKGK